MDLASRRGSYCHFAEIIILKPKVIESIQLSRISYCVVIFNSRANYVDCVIFIGNAVLIMIPLGKYLQISDVWYSIFLEVL